MGINVWRVSTGDLVTACARVLPVATIHRRIESAPRRRSFSVTAAPVAGREASSSVLVLHDITELRRWSACAGIRANVSPLIQTPLTLIQGVARTLLGGALDDRPTVRVR